MTYPCETEIKLSVASHDPTRQRLRELGATLKERVENEHDLQFRSTSDPQILKDRVLRLRQEGTGGMLTWKGNPAFREGVKIREEIQTKVSDAGAMRGVLERLGYEVHFEYSKTREYWNLCGLTVSLDELPFGLFVEIEGEEEMLEGAVHDLGLEGAERVEEGYPILAARYLGVER